MVLLYWRSVCIFHSNRSYGLIRSFFHFSCVDIVVCTESPSSLQESARERAKERNRKIWYFKMDGNDTKAWRHKQAQESPYTFSKMIRPAFNNRNEQQQTQPFLKPAFSENPIEISRQNTFSNTQIPILRRPNTFFVLCYEKSNDDGERVSPSLPSTWTHYISDSVQEFIYLLKQFINFAFFSLGPVLSIYEISIKWKLIKSLAKAERKKGQID